MIDKNMDTPVISNTALLIHSKSNTLDCNYRTYFYALKLPFKQRLSFVKHERESQFKVVYKGFLPQTHL